MAAHSLGHCPRADAELVKVQGSAILKVDALLGRADIAGNASEHCDIGVSVTEPLDRLVHHIKGLQSITQLDIVLDLEGKKRRKGDS